MRFSPLLLLLFGCGTPPYPATLTYPPRSDLLVLQLPTTPPAGPPPAGKLDEWIGSLRAQGGTTLNPAEVPAEAAARLQAILLERFGTPAEPRLNATGAGAVIVAELSLQPDVLAAGSVLYRKHCLQCHGLTGDGRGPTGQWVQPAPRDFRQGIYKFVSSAGTGSRKPSREDMHRSLVLGVERTSMPAFAMLGPEDRNRLISYTIHLSLRGEVEFRMLKELLSADGDIDDDWNAEADRILLRSLHDWQSAERDTIDPSTHPTPETLEGRITPEHLESVRRGHELFRGEAINCIGCHADYGRQPRWLYDAWGGSVRASDLSEGVFRGGKQPIEVFQRIRGGVGPSGMPGAATLSDEQVWDLVHFMLALPVPSMLPADVRADVYPNRAR